MELGEELRGRLNNLVGLEILYEKALYPELEYIFKNALTQEVAYESLLKQRRQEIHGRIAGPSRNSMLIVLSRITSCLRIITREVGRQGRPLSI